MIKKITLFTFLICFSVFIVKAQKGFNYSQYDLGTSVGFNQVFGDAQTQPYTQSIHFALTYNYTPYTNFVFEVQLGKFQGGDSVANASGRQFTNDFSAYIFRGQLQAGEFIDYSRGPLFNSLKGLYVSAGIGYMVSHITNINRNSIQYPGFFTDGLNDSMEPFIPLRIGYELKLFNKYEQPNIKFDFAYEYNLILGDDLDGFAAVPGHHDIYTQFTFGVRFALGAGVTSYRKEIHY
jgi:hypothetical protein